MSQSKDSQANVDDKKELEPEVKMKEQNNQMHSGIEASLAVPKKRSGKLTNVRSNSSLVSYDQVVGHKRNSPGKHRINEKDIKVAQLVAANE